MAQCGDCQAVAFVDCTCPPGVTDATGWHLAECQMENIQGQVQCREGAGCCTEDHSGTPDVKVGTIVFHGHDAAAMACPGLGNNHPGADCPVGPSCVVVTEAGEDCPGGHCAKGVDGCTVCRPITITAMPGSANLLPATGQGA
jgi:hypothetical protein